MMLYRRFYYFIRGFNLSYKTLWILPIRDKRTVVRSILSRPGPSDDPWIDEIYWIWNSERRIFKILNERKLKIIKYNYSLRRQQPAQNFRRVILFFPEFQNFQNLNFEKNRIFEEPGTRISLTCLKIFYFSS